MADEQNQPPQPPQDPQFPQPPRPPQGSPQQPQPFGYDDGRELKSAQSLVIAASITGPISMLVGGVFLGVVGLVCGILAFRKIKGLMGKGGAIAFMARKLRTACIIALVVTAIALVLNIVNVVMVYPLMMEALQTGDYSQLLPGGTESSAGGNSTWG